MIILSASDLGHAFGADELFNGLTLRLRRKDRVGLVGPNGVGKTTLLLILSGLLTPTSGSIIRDEHLTTGTLRQEAVLAFSGRENSVYQEMLTVFNAIQTKETAMRQLEETMSAGKADESLLVEYGRLQDEYELQGGYRYRHEIKRVLLGLGFAQEEWNTPLTHLSGGQKTRLLLGRLLLEKPALLILDEPTNHLDLAAVEWLEETLRRWEGALIIVSHDRYFLDRVVNRVWAMSPDSLRAYRGNYTRYLQQRGAEWERELSLFQAEKSRLENELAFIRKHIAGGKSDIAKGKLKRLTRDILLWEQIGVMGVQGKSWLKVGERARTLSANEAARRIENLHPPENQPPRLNIRLQSEERSGRIVLRTGELRVGFGEPPIITSDRIRLERLDCAALIGPNGSGKTTLLRTLLGEMSPLEGWIKYGDSVKIGYFAQGHEQLSQQHRVIDEISSRQPEMPADQARTFLANYLFKGDDVFKRVSDLSGGERGWLALALLSLKGANFLLLDEPTNHLDIPSQEILQSVLEQFEGTILLVSHDRYLVARLATQIWDIEDGRLRIFEGNYNDYLIAKAVEADEIEAENALADEDMNWVEEIAPIPVGKKAQRAQNKRLEKIETRMVEYELLSAQIRDEILAAVSEDQLAVLRDEYKVVQAELVSMNEEWEQLNA